MEELNLSWKNYQQNISTSFKKLRQKTEFHDVTLVSCDQKQVFAHKVVLSAGSEFFSNILQKNEHTPLINIFAWFWWHSSLDSQNYYIAI